MNEIISSILGFALGDAFGVPFEFKTKDIIKKMNPSKMTGYGTHSQPKGTFSDDTSMLLATLDCFINKGYSITDLADNFLAWYYCGKWTPYGRVFDIGNTTKRVLISIKEDGISPFESGEREILSNGNGSLMRILPFVFYLYYSKKYDHIVEIIDEVSSITHAHPISVTGCLIFTEYFLKLIEGNDKKEAYSKMKESMKKYKDSKILSGITPYNRILNYDIALFPEDQIKASGYVVDTVESVLWTFLNTDNYKDSIIQSTLLGDDTDTTAAITGSLSGYYYGMDSIPKDMLKDLKKRDMIEKLAGQFCDYLNLLNKGNCSKR